MGQWECVERNQTDQVIGKAFYNTVKIVAFILYLFPYGQALDTQ